MIKKFLMLSLLITSLSANAQFGKLLKDLEDLSKALEGAANTEKQSKSDQPPKQSLPSQPQIKPSLNFEQITKELDSLIINSGADGKKLMSAYEATIDKGLRKQFNTATATVRWQSPKQKEEEFQGFITGFAEGVTGYEKFSSPNQAKMIAMKCMIADRLVMFSGLEPNFINVLSKAITESDPFVADELAMKRYAALAKTKQERDQMAYTVLMSTTKGGYDCQSKFKQQ